MPGKQYLVTVMALQVILWAGCFDLLAQQSRANRHNNRNQTLLPAVFPNNDLHSKEGRLALSKALSEINPVERCSKNPDSLYNRQKVLARLARILNNTATGFHNAKYLNKEEMRLASVKNERPVGFFVYDLTDDSNIGMPLGQCVELKNGHVYHFSLLFAPYSFSHIVILENGHLKVFKALNCKKGDRLEDVMSDLNQQLQDSKDKDEIISRVRNYRKYGMYGATDDSALRCEPE